MKTKMLMSILVKHCLAKNIIKFLAELEKIKAEKGADYFQLFSKDEIMGDSPKGLYDTITGTAGGGKPESSMLM